MKRNKNQVSREASLPHEAFTLQNAMRRGYVPLLRNNPSLLLTGNSNVPDAFANPQPLVRIAFSPEAYLLTDYVK